MKKNIGSRLMPLALALSVGISAAASAQENPAAAAAQSSPIIATQDFAARSPFANARMSPDGQRIAFTVTLQNVTRLNIFDVESGKVIVNYPLPDQYDFNWLRWAGSDRVLFGLSGMQEIYNEDYRYTRTYVFDIPANKFAYVGNKSMGFIGDDILHIDRNGEWVLLALQRDVYSEPEVWRMMLDRTKSDADERVVRLKADVWDWHADNAGVVRLGLGYIGKTLQVWYRPDATKDFKRVARIKEDAADEDIWDALRIVTDSDDGFLLREDEDGRMVLRHFNYATREVGETVFRNSDWDLTDYTLDESGKPNAVYFTDDRDRIVWLDEAMAKTQKSLEKALPGQEVWIASRARDNSRMLVWSGGPTDPGVYYIYTPAKKTLDIFSALRPNIEPEMLAATKPVTYDARDGTKIHSYLTLPQGKVARNLPLIIMPHGGPYGVRDKLQYSDEVQLLANRGYAVLQPNYRGSDGYGKKFAELGIGEIGRKMQDDLDDGVDWAVAQGIADRGRVCMVGSSYGGYAAMWAAIRNPDIYRCVVSFAGVTDWKKQLKYDEDFLTRKGRQSWNEKVRGAETSFDLDTISPAPQAAKIGTPLLLVHGEKDSNVPLKQYRYMRDALQRVPDAKVEYLTFKEAGHGFSSAEDEQSYYDHLLDFLARYNPVDVTPAAAGAK